MRITRSSQPAREPLDADHFSGPGSRRDLGSIDTPAGSALVVSFEAATRTSWHRHPAGQVLYVLEGIGQVGTRSGEMASIGPGDLVYAPPGEEHWHGSVEAEPMSHLALSFGDTEWLEPVTDE